MKKLFLFLILFCCNPIFSQNNYDVYVIKKDKPNPVLDVVRETGRVQSQMQQRYNYNYERFSNAFNDINNKIYALQVDKETKNRIISRWTLYVNQINSLNINFTSTVNVTNVINHSYNEINKVIYEESE
jgi:hypothetical protein